ncbi:MAG: Na/Pi cotransporter family protein [Acutalibacteraceae bacterium]
MDVFDILSLIGGLALFLFGMEVMGTSLEKQAGSKLKTILGKMTETPLKGFLLGVTVTAVIQSSSATTVMVVGFVNSGIMTLHQAISIIMGANIGTTVTSWILSLSGLSGDSIFVTLLKPTSFVPVLALVGVILMLRGKNPKQKTTGYILLGFATLMTGMTLMSDAVSGLKDVPEFTNILTLFTNPILGVLAGAALTAIVQSSSASVGILQALSVTGAISYGAAIPIVMGQNIGTTVTALLSSMGANKNAKRTAVVHLYFNLLGTVAAMVLFYSVNAIFRFNFTENIVDGVGIAVLHTVFNVFCTLLWAPFTKLLEKLAFATVKDNEEKEKYEMLDERLFATPAIAVQRCTTVAGAMAEIAKGSVESALSVLAAYDERVAEKIRHDEKKTDKYEDKLGSYLVKLSARELSEEDSAETAKLLHIIGDLERLSDHAVNVLESAEEIREKGLEFSGDCENELSVMIDSVMEILDLSYTAFIQNDMEKAMLVEPLEQVVDDLKDELKARHVKRLQKGECTIELGFVLSDLLRNLERISDHCSNIAGLVLEMDRKHDLSIHKYLKKVRKGENDYNGKYMEFTKKYEI